MSNMKEYRVKKNLTQENVSCSLCITLRHYQNIEAGRAIPNVILGLRLSLLFEVDPFLLWLNDKCR